MADMIEAEGLVKAFGDFRAVDGVDLRVDEGRVLGLLGPNGAGKTTVVRMLATLLDPTGGRARVAGHDVIDEPSKVRAAIGLNGQYAAIDENLTGRENIEMVGQLYQLPRRHARQRAGDLLERFDLSDAANRPAKTYSGGMTRRLDLACSLVGRPRVLFLDEPTTGLDPRSRRDMWQVIDELVKGGATLLLTTQYLEEADVLADEIAVIDHGRIVAEGTADELKSQVGGDTLELTPSDQGRVQEAAELLGDLARGDGSGVQVEGGSDRRFVALPVGDDDALLATAARRLDDVGIGIADIGVRRPSLDDVFFGLTGQAPADGQADGQADGASTGERTAA